MQKLAVLGFSGEHGDAVAAAMKSRLWDSEFYTLVDPSELHAIRWASSTDGSTSLLSLNELQTARSAGIDGVLIGDVIEYRCEDRTEPEHDRVLGWLPRRQRQEVDCPRPGQPVEATGQTTRRDATVTVAFRLVDTKTGNIRASRQISHSASVSAADRPNSAPAATPESLLNDLVLKCVDEFVGTLAPRQVTEPLELAAPMPFQGGFTLVQNGNEFAVRGRWDEAIAAWEQAVAANPENDAALFNLSLAHAHRQQFNQAESFAIRAMNVRQKAEYQAALQRIREQTAAYDQTLQQRRDVTMLSFDDDVFHLPRADRASADHLANRNAPKSRSADR